VGVGVGVGTGVAVGAGVGVGVGVGFGPLSARAVGENAKQTNASTTDVAMIFGDVFMAVIPQIFRDFSVFPRFWEYAEMRTNALDKNIRFFLTYSTFLKSDVATARATKFANGCSRH
jgi:hypothetical protein